MNTAKTYSEKLRDPRWQKKRLEVLSRDNFTCVKCGDKETELHVHHLKYTGDPWKTKNNNLTTLCKNCHKIITYLKGVEIERIVKYNSIYIAKVKNNDSHIFNINTLNHQVSFIKSPTGGHYPVHNYKLTVKDIINGST